MKEIKGVPSSTSGVSFQILMKSADLKKTVDYNENCGCGFQNPQFSLKFTVFKICGFHRNLKQKTTCRWFSIEIRGFRGQNHIITFTMSSSTVFRTKDQKSTMSMLMFSFWTIWWIGSNVPSGHRAHARLCTNVCASVNLQIKQTWQMSASFLYMALVWIEYGENIPTAGSFHYSGGWPRSNFLHPNKVNGHVCALHTSEALFQSSLTGKLGGYWRKQRIINSFSDGSMLIKCH